ncbi:transglycosylase SLT domain-containing protein [Pseudovibrio ascidiaceicola]|uniref:lytic transglycosylase domain-containing protein n=1 Tax=Pseudovibrio ascidiaceicola TaxID=285279 RepID=UPI003D36F2EA
MTQEQYQYALDTGSIHGELGHRPVGGPDQIGTMLDSMLPENAPFFKGPAGHTIERQTWNGILDGARETGFSVSVLAAIAERESGFNQQARNKKTSAAGLFQFVDQSWLLAMMNYGKEHGLGNYVKDLYWTKNDEGNDYIAVKRGRETEILDLRYNPRLAALMAAESLSAAKRTLEAKTGLNLRAEVTYLAQFMGTKGATFLLRAGENLPDAPAVDFFPKFAQANPNVFYAEGQPRTLGELKNELSSDIAERARQYDSRADELGYGYPYVFNEPIPER